MAGYLFAKSSTSVTIGVQLVNYITGTVIASVAIPFAGGDWTQLNFTLETSAGTSCVGITVRCTSTVDSVHRRMRAAVVSE